MAAFSLLTHNLISSNPKPLPLSSSSSSSYSFPLLFPIPANHLSFSSSSSSNTLPFPLLRQSRTLEFGFVRKVAFSSELGQEEGEEEEFNGDEERGSFSPDLKLFVGNLPFSVDSSELAQLFGSAGTVEQVEVIYDKLSGGSRGFGFVTMSTVEEVEAAAQQFNGYEYQGRALRVNSGPPPPRRDDGPSRGFRSGGAGGGSFDSANRLYVGNLSWGVDNAALESVFSEQGKVMDARVVYDRESGRSRGFGFVTYCTAEEANNAISSLDGSDLDGRTIRVTVAEARPPRRQF